MLCMLIKYLTTRTQQKVIIDHVDEINMRTICCKYIDIFQQDMKRSIGLPILKYFVTKLLESSFHVTHIMHMAS